MRACVCVWVCGAKLEKGSWPPSDPYEPGEEKKRCVMQSRGVYNRGEPYNKHGRANYHQPRPSDTSAGAIVAIAPASGGSGAVVSQVAGSDRGGPRRLTFNNFRTFSARNKKTPLDANTSAAPNTKLWQLSEQVSFYCNKCRRDNIISDSLAIDAVHQLMLCTRCFTRIIRPRTYRPSRVVPFPSLLSWLNYTPSRVMEMSEDIASRPAEAVAPSADRVAVPTIPGGSRPTHIQQLPATAMNTVSNAGNVGGALLARGMTAASQQQQSLESSKHPCHRVWGSCLHGETCLFRGAPYDLCICFLMGLCNGDEATCNLLHQRVFALPDAEAPMPLQRCEGDLEDPESAWGKWVGKKKNSANSAEWQLWNNGPILELINRHAPATPVAVAEEKGGDNVKPRIKLHFADISAALKGLQK